MPMRLARAAHAAGMRHTTTRGRLSRFSSSGRGERGKLFGQLLRTAVRTFCSLPLARTDKDLTVLLALPAMKFIDRHGGRIITKAGLLNSVLLREISGFGMGYALVASRHAQLHLAWPYGGGGVDRCGERFS